MSLIQFVKTSLMSEVKRASVLFDQGHTRVTDGVSVVSAGAAIPEEAADATPNPPNNDGDDNEQHTPRLRRA